MIRLLHNSPYHLRAVILRPLSETSDPFYFPRYLLTGFLSPQASHVYNSYELTGIIRCLSWISVSRMKLPRRNVATTGVGNCSESSRGLLSGSSYVIPIITRYSRTILLDITEVSSGTSSGKLHRIMLVNHFMSSAKGKAANSQVGTITRLTF